MYKVRELTFAFGCHFAFSFSKHRLIQGQCPSQRHFFQHHHLRPLTPINTNNSNYRVTGCIKKCLYLALHTNTYTDTRHPKNKTTPSSFSEKKTAAGSFPSKSLWGTTYVRREGWSDVDSAWSPVVTETWKSVNFALG